MENEEVYQVKGIVSSWDEMLYYAHPPILVEATFLPFKDVIIPDSLARMYNIVIGGNMTRDFKDMYMQAKKNGRIHRTL